MFNKKRFIDNVAFLVNQNNMKFEKFEKSIGLRSGEFFNWSVDESKKSVPTSWLLKISNKLGVSMDLLCKDDCSKMITDEFVLKNFLTALADDTSKYMCTWENKMYYDPKIAVAFFADGAIGGEENYISGFKDGVFNRKKLKCIFVTDLKMDMQVAVIKLQYGDCPGDYSIEVYLYKDEMAYLLCGYDNNKYSDKNDYILALFNAITGGEGAFRVANESRKFMQDFLDKSEYQRYTGLPF